MAAVMFEAFTQRPKLQRGWWLSLSLAAHLLVVLALWWVLLDRRPPPPALARTPVTFFSLPPPPPPAGGGAAAKRPKEPKVKRPARVVPPNEIAQPQTQKEPREAPQENPGEKNGQAGGVQGGVAGGVVGGVVGGAISEFDGRMTPPRLIAGPQIQYTDKALENDVEGLMIVRCVLGVTGEVRNCVVKQSVRFMDNAVVETLQKRRYTPVTLEGRPIEVYYNFRIRLTLPR